MSRMCESCFRPIFSYSHKICNQHLPGCFALKGKCEFGKKSSTQESLLAQKFK
jgi:hypothetical protein